MASLSIQQSLTPQEKKNVATLLKSSSITKRKAIEILRAHDGNITRALDALTNSDTALPHQRQNGLSAVGPTKAEQQGPSQTGDTHRQALEDRNNPLPSHDQEPAPTTKPHKHDPQPPIQDRKTRRKPNKPSRPTRKLDFHIPTSEEKAAFRNLIARVKPFLIPALAELNREISQEVCTAEQDHERKRKEEARLRSLRRKNSGPKTTPKHDNQKTMTQRLDDFECPYHAPTNPGPHAVLPSSVPPPPPGFDEAFLHPRKAPLPPRPAPRFPASCSIISYTLTLTHHKPPRTTAPLPLCICATLPAATTTLSHIKAEFAARSIHALLPGSRRPVRTAYDIREWSAQDGRMFGFEAWVKEKGERVLGVTVTEEEGGGGKGVEVLSKGVTREEVRGVLGRCGVGGSF